MRLGLITVAVAIGDGLCCSSETELLALGGKIDCRGPLYAKGQTRIGQLDCGKNARQADRADGSRTIQKLLWNAPTFA